MMKCRTVQPQLFDFSSGRLEPVAARKIAAHLAVCMACRAVQQRELETDDLLGSLTPSAPAANAWETVEGVLRRRTTSTAPRWVTSRSMFRIGGLATAAALVLGLIASVRPVEDPGLDVLVLRAMTPSAASGLSTDRGADPLNAVQSRMDWLLQGVAEHGS